jgi:CHAT domain-containing protein/tetratricopeptide (TPR) repeat protein
MMVQNSREGKTSLMVSENSGISPNFWYVKIALLSLAMLVTGVKQAPATKPVVTPLEQAWALSARGEHAAAWTAAQANQGVLAVWIMATAREDGLLPHPDQDLQGYAETEITAACLTHAKADFAAASQHFSTSIEALENETWNAADELHAKLLQGSSLVELGQIAAADSVLSLCVISATELDLPVSLCFAHLTRGRTRVRMRLIDEPRQDLEAALALANDLDLPRFAGTAAIALSVVSRLQMDLDDALQWRELALISFLQARDKPGQTRALHYIATIKAMQGDLTRSMTMLQDALILARETGNEAEAGGILGEMAGIDYLLGNYDQALDEYEEAVRLAPNPWRRGMMLINIGSIREYRGEYAEARQVLENALSLMSMVGDHRTEAKAMSALGEVLCEMKEFEAGLAMLDGAIALAREYETPMTEAYALKCRGHGLLDKGDLAGAEIALAEASKIARQIKYFDILEYSLLGLAQVARRQGNSKQALLYLDEALDDIDAVRRQSGGSAAVTGGIGSKMQGIASELVSLCYDLHKQHPDGQYAHHAFAAAQRAKARTFLDLLAEAEFDLKYSAIPGYREMEGEILTRMVALDERLAEAQNGTVANDTLINLKARLATNRNELGLLEARLREADPRYAEVLLEDTISLARVQKELLNPAEVYLEYAIGDSASYVWAITSNEIYFEILPPRQEIETKVRALLPLLHDYNLTAGNAGWYEQPARELFELLVRPVYDAFDAASTLTISPDGILHYLPFETLLTHDSGAKSFTDLPWLIQEKTVSYTPSASVLRKLRTWQQAEKTNTQPKERWLLFGDPELVKGANAGLFARAAGATDLPALPFAKQELETLEQLANNDGTIVLTGPRATKTNLRQAGESGPFSLVHFASHGLFNEDRPRYSGLVTSPDQSSGDDGFLSVSEVFGLHLECDQVVLSACASALGDHVTGEGLVGLTRSFIFAGSRSVVAALWDVSGEASSDFMIKFYDKLRKQDIDRSLALASAKLEMIQIGSTAGGLDYAHPSFWAAFVISGDGRIQ